MTKTPDFLKENKDAGIDTAAMVNLAKLIDTYDDAAKALATAEAIAKEKKTAFNALILEQIPEFLLSHGIAKMALSDGREVKIKEDISATVKDDVAFRIWLKQRNEEAIIKTKYSFPQMNNAEISALSDFLADNDYEFEIDESIHSATKKKYFKELLKGMARTDLPDWVNIYDIRKAVIK